MTVVPEPVVKEMLAAAGVVTPRGCHFTGAIPHAEIARLQGPLVLKAYGDEIVHKSELGAVRLGLTAGEVAGAVEEMAASVAAAGCVATGFLVEEQQAAGTELLLGVTVRDGVATVVAGLGGIYAELLDAVAVRLLPLDRSTASEMLRDFPGSAVLDGVRGRPPADVEAVTDLLLAIAGEDGLATRLLAEGLADLECNPVIVGADGAVAVDARLILGSTGPPRSPAPARDLTPLFAPRSIAVAGASARGRNLGNVALAAYRAFGWTDRLYALHPTAREIDGVPAYPSPEALPERSVDYLKAAVPADGLEPLLRSGRFAVAQVLTGGFGERDDDGRSLEARLRSAARETGTILVGPNCLGTYCPEGRQTFQIGAPRDAGDVAIVAQSGGLASDLVLAGAARGLRFSKVISLGNAVDLAPGEVVDHLVDDAGTAVIALYLEGLADLGGLLAALRRACGVKPVLILMAGETAAGAAAIASHTGALAPDGRVLDAVARATGAGRVATFEQLVDALVYVQRYAGRTVRHGPSVTIAGSGGGASALAAEAAERAGVTLGPLSPSLAAALAALDLGVPKNLLNPLEVILSPTTEPERLAAVLAAVSRCGDASDVIVHLSLATFFGLDEPGADRLRDLVAAVGRAAVAEGASDPRFALVARVSDVAPPGALARLRAAALDARLPLYHRFEDALGAIAALQSFKRRPGWR